MAYQGFAKVQGAIEKEGKSPKQAAGIAAAIGRKKMGKAAFQAKAAAGKRKAAANVKAKSGGY